ncbi:MAG: hypothetical protein ACRDS1_09635 [Pseudonocardiaceae bacterium]
MLGAAQWQGIGVLVAVAFGVLTWWQARQSRRHDLPEQTSPSSGGVLIHRWKLSPSVASRLGGALLVLVVSYTLFAGVWAVFAFVLKSQPEMVISSDFVIFAAPSGFLALVMRWPFVGGFLGGAIPLSMFALYHAEEMARNAQSPPSALAFFVVFFILGGMIGALTAGPMVIGARSLGIPLPRNYRRAQPVNT